MAQGTPRIEHVKYIRATTDAVWRALTDARETRKYFFDQAQITSDFTAGSGVRYTRGDDPATQAVVVQGEILSAEPGRRLQHTFALPDIDEPPSQVCWDISPFGRTHVKLALIHQGFAGESRTYQRMKNTWAGVLTRLQTLLENGGHGWQ